MRSPEIIAELSANHLGDFHRALALIEAASLAGAEAVKLQCWSPERMARPFKIGYGPWAGRDFSDLYREAFTPWDWFPRLFDHAKGCDIECFSSVFDHEALAFLESIACPRYKIASFEITDLPLIRAVASTRKPIVISTGLATREEIERACVAAKAAPELTLLKCTSSYPAPIAEANIAAMNALPSMCPWANKGLSDHTLGSTAAIVATANRAHMIEKHLTLSRADGGPDAGFSSEPLEFKAMVDACREAALAIGEVRYGPTAAEKPALIFRRSLYVIRDLKAGTRITRDMLQSSRPAVGLPPDHPVEGRALLRDMAAGEPLKESDLAG